MLISDQYMDLNRRLHMQDEGYGLGGWRWSSYFYHHVMARHLKPQEHLRILDYGAGKGSFKTHLITEITLSMKPLSYEIEEYDPAMPGIDIPPTRKTPYDVVTCLDVLEHVEPNCLEHVLEHIKTISKKAFLVIACKASNKTLPDGRNAHLIVESREWWFERLLRHWDTVTPLPHKKRQESYLVCLVFDQEIDHESPTADADSPVL